MEETVWANVEGPRDVPELGVYASDAGLFEVGELFELLDMGFTVVIVE